ncbi:hydratase [Paracoccus sp. S1E-3]|uniref:hydratase n=1 Tax=Paracoccus sp. S1E-3 TaxID=2756130 RepID=UPI0015EF5655|nr:hydratase [Paracoccus sp. S1E-3]MBA4492604.1 hydratase [Paracoccus sp. S1E-3]
MKYAIAILALTAGPALAVCPAPEAMQRAAQGWLQGERLPDPGVASMEDAACAYAAYRARLEQELGAPVGVKVGFTSKPAQERFGVDGPVAGALFQPMLAENGGEVSLAGSRSPLYEADLVVTVADPVALAAAKTREEAAAALGDVQAFVEMPDMALAEGLKPNGPIMASYGVIPWRGVLGDKIAIADLADPVADLGSLTAVLKADGQVMDEASGAALLGHPLDVVLWLVGQRGYDLSEGSIISLGSLGQLHPATPGLAIEADYMVGGKPLKVAFTTVE